MINNLYAFLRIKHIQVAILIALLILVYILLYKIYSPRINAFGCFDDCFNFMGGYYTLQGKRIFTDFFYNHQPGMAYFSALIQLVSDPKSIPELILRHRQAVMIISFVINLLILMRFGKIFLGSIIIFEFTKFYVFGDRFLAEGLIVYLLIYITASVWQGLFYNKTKNVDLLIIPFFTWAVLFFREPFIPAALCLFGLYIFILRKKKKDIMRVVLLFTGLSAIVLLTINVSDYIYNVFILNHQQFSNELSPQRQFYNLIISFFYPYYIILSPESWTPFRIFLGVNTGIFITSTAILVLKYKKIKEVLFVITILTFINLRPTEANKSFYEAFHIIPWFGLLLFSTTFFVSRIYQKSKKVGIVLFLVISINFLQFTLNNQYFAYEKVNPSEEYFVHFSHIMGAGTVIRNLSNPDDTLFVDGLDELVAWEAKRPSSYQYTWYTSFMPSVEKYNSAKTTMFQTVPPDFYYGACLKEHMKDNTIVSKIISEDYTQLKSGSTKTCIFINNKKINEVSEVQKLKLNGYDYYF